MDPRKRTPAGVWALITALAAIQPLLHVGIREAPPEGTVPTGLHIPDSALFLYSMDMFHTGFKSHYATCRSAVGDQDVCTAKDQHPELQCIEVTHSRYHETGRPCPEVLLRGITIS